MHEFTSHLELETNKSLLFLGGNPVIQRKAAHHQQRSSQLRGKRTKSKEFLHHTAKEFHFKIRQSNKSHLLKLGEEADSHIDFVLQERVSGHQELSARTSAEKTLG